MQIVSALRYLNEIKPPIIHYDLKPGESFFFTKSCKYRKLKRLNMRDGTLLNGSTTFLETAEMFANVSPFEQHERSISTNLPEICRRIKILPDGKRKLLISET